MFYSFLVFKVVSEHCEHLEHCVNSVYILFKDIRKVLILRLSENTLQGNGNFFLVTLLGIIIWKVGTIDVFK